MDGLEKVIAICEDLQKQLENDCLVPPQCLGGEMLSVYEETRADQLSVIKRVCNQLYALQEMF